MVKSTAERVTPQISLPKNKNRKRKIREIEIRQDHFIHYLYDITDKKAKCTNSASHKRGILDSKNANTKKIFFDLYKTDIIATNYSYNFGNKIGLDKNKNSFTHSLTHLKLKSLLIGAQY